MINYAFGRYNATQCGCFCKSRASKISKFKKNILGELKRQQRKEQGKSATDELFLEKILFYKEIDRDQYTGEDSEGDERKAEPNSNSGSVFRMEDFTSGVPLKFSQRTINRRKKANDEEQESNRSKAMRIRLKEGKNQQLFNSLLPCLRTKIEKIDKNCLISPLYGLQDPSYTFYPLFRPLLPSLTNFPEYFNFVVSKVKIEETKLMADINDIEREFYTALIIQFAFICLFSPHFIACGFLSYFINIGVITLTMSFYGYFAKRSQSRRISNIGIWNNLFNYISIAGIVYNCVVILTPNTGFTGLIQFEDRETTIIFLVILENCILGLKFFLNEIIPSEPNWVKQKKRSESKAKKLAEEKSYEDMEFTRKLLKKSYKERFGVEGANYLEHDNAEDNEVKFVYDHGLEVESPYLEEEQKIRFPLLEVR